MLGKLFYTISFFVFLVSYKAFNSPWRNKHTNSWFTCRVIPYNPNAAEVRPEYSGGGIVVLFQRVCVVRCATST